MFRLLHPAYEAIEHFFFAPSTTTTTAPHVRDPIDLKRFMSMVIISLVPSILVGLYLFGLRFIAIVVVSYASGLTVELLFAIVRKEGINEGFFVTGILFPLIMPPAVPLWMVALGVAFGVFVGKEVFGGTGRNLFNPALLGRCFLALAYPAQMSGSWLSPGQPVVSLQAAQHNGKPDDNEHPGQQAHHPVGPVFGQNGGNGRPAPGNGQARAQQGKKGAG